MNRTHLSLLLIFSLFPLCAAIAAPVYISGQVSAEGAAAPPVTAISLYGPNDASPLLTTSPLSNGSYTLKMPGRGRYRLEARAGGYLPIIQSVDVQSAGLPRLDLHLLQAHPLQLRVLQNGAPLPPMHAEAWLWLLRKDDRAWFYPYSLEVAAGGVVSIPVPAETPADDFEKISQLRIELRTASGCGKVDLDGWTSPPAPIVLKPGLHIAGIVQDAAGTPEEGANITAARLIRPGWALSHPEYITTTTDRAGHFNVPALFSETYRLLFHLRDGKQISRDINVIADVDKLNFGPGDPPPVVEHYGVGNEIPVSPMIERLHPERTGKMPVVEGRVVDWTTGEPIEHASLWLLADKREDNSLDVAWSDSTGHFRMTAPHPGAYRLGAEGPHQYRSYSALQLMEGSSATTVRLLAAHPLSVRVQDADGKPIGVGSVNTGMWISSPAGSAYDENPAAVGPDGLITLRPPVWLTVQAPADLSNINVAVRSETLGCGRTHQDTWPAAPLVVQLEKGYSLHGQVLEPGGQPTRGGNVQIYARDYQSAPVCRASTDTGEGGKFELPHLLPGKYHLFAYGAGANADQDIVLPLTGPGDRGITIQLVGTPGGVLK